MPKESLSRREVMTAMLAGVAVAGTQGQLADGAEPVAAAATGALDSRHSKIAIEEHMSFPAAEGVLFHPPHEPPGAWESINARLQDVERQRLPLMQQHGIAMQVVSLTANGPQGEPDPRRALAIAQQANDYMMEHFVSRYPQHFAAFAAVALQDPEAGCRELERAVKQLGFKGVLVNGYSNVKDLNTGEYLDLPKFAPFWACTQELDVPVYLHPRLPLPSQQLIYEGHEEMIAAMWGFGAETAAHALRLITSGLFDRYPRQQVILGHMGEGLVAMIARAQRRFEYRPCGKALKKPVSQYLRDNFYITTSGNFHTPTLNNVIEEVGIDRVIFSVDYPYENMAEGATWFDNCPLKGQARDKVARLNVQRLLKLA